MQNLKITDVRTILTAPGGIDLVVVKLKRMSQVYMGLDALHLLSG